MSSSSESDVNVYGYVPDRQANLAALVCFAVMWFFNAVISLWYRQWWFGTAFFIGFGLETGGYVGRYLSHGDPNNLNYFLDQIICLTLGPAFFMGGVYFLLAKYSMIYKQGVGRLKPMMYSYIFVSCDLVSIILQAIGGGMAATALQDDEDTAPGTHVMVAGLAVQVASMSLFMGLCLDFMLRVRKLRKTTGDIYNPDYVHIPEAKLYTPLFYAIGICTLLIYVRCIYRLIELAEGWSGYLILHEPYFLVLEALIVWLGTATLTVIHPGFVLKKYHIPVKGLGRKKKQNERNTPDSGYHLEPMAGEDEFAGSTFGVEKGNQSPA